MPVVGILAATSAEANALRMRAFREALSATGYVDGQNVRIKYRWAEAHTGRLPELAAQLAQDQVAVLVAAGGTASALAAKAATASIPIVFGIGADPVQIGLVASLNRPGGNVTGVTNLNVEVLPKRLELLQELVPTTRVVALLVNPTDPANAEPGLRAAERFPGLASELVNLPVDVIVAWGPSDRRLRRPYSQRRKAWRAANPAGHESRTVAEPQDRQGVRPYRANRSACPRRRGH
jgi:putative ABC transport system substrate-binding protein